MKKLAFSIVILILLHFQANEAVAQFLNFNSVQTASRVLGGAKLVQSNEKFDLQIINRSQWNSLDGSVSTNAAAFSTHINSSKKIQFGLVLLTDESAFSKFSFTKAQVTIGYTLNAGNHAITAALQGGFTGFRFKNQSVTFPAQYDSELGYFSNLLPNGEFSSVLNPGNFIQVGTGIRHAYFQPKFGIETVVSLDYLNRPSIEVAATSTNLPASIFISSTQKWLLNNSYSFQVGELLYVFNNQSIALVEATVGFVLPTNSAGLEELGFGIHSRSSVEMNLLFVGPTVNLTFSKFSAYLRYEFGTHTTTRALGGLNGVEMGLKYRIKLPNLNDAYLPCRNF